MRLYPHLANNAEMLLRETLIVIVFTTRRESPRALYAPAKAADRFGRGHTRRINLSISHASKDRNCIEEVLLCDLDTNNAGKLITESRRERMRRLEGPPDPLTAASNYRARARNRTMYHDYFIGACWY
ncbi:hypothetical protein EVAR_24000_1 [Eumeta japonica]|uniref:Uncharacterized protein n=1 Tax=Eumeta variegata TaxID=151549 RepID=A0A4C1WA60_EUMVA|nr:hypothetical protein EVAR_24000_1 [Eumeta japonica]